MHDIVLGEILIAGLASLLISIFLGPKFIQFLREREFGQHIREEGPEAHHLTKAGTPTMGGLVIWTAIAIPYLILSERDAASLAVFGTALAAAAIGFADDWLKIVKSRSLGLPARTKLLLQLLIAIGLWYVATQEVGLSETIEFRIFDAQLDVGGFYVVLVFLVLAGATNGVNLTDGLDGLAGGCCAIVLLAYTAMAFVTGGQDGLSGLEREGLALLGACLVGASVGFLWFNSFPAAIFMGDTGSLGLGGAIAGMAVMTKSEVLLIVIGGIFVIEALSVAAQVFTFRVFRRRILLMAPVHHHFELMGWSENKIIVRFWILTAIFSAIGFTLFQQSVGA
jgi:phospho-N-acetylmuramoyl-pentapeptide-transferase